MNGSSYSATNELFMPRLSTALDVKACRIFAVRAEFLHASAVKPCRISSAFDVVPYRISAALDAILWGISAPLDAIPW